jgi:hypothetical protein
MEQSPSWEANWFCSWSRNSPHSMEPESSLPHSQAPAPRLLWVFRNLICFYGEELLAHRPTPKLEDHPSSAVRDCLFNVFAAALHIGGRSSIRHLRTRHAVVTGTHKILPSLKRTVYSPKGPTKNLSVFVYSRALLTQGPPSLRGSPGPYPRHCL